MKYLKYTLFLLYFVILANFVFAQDTGNKTVSGIYYNVSLKKVIQNLEKETSYSFTYLDTLISGKNITVSFLNKPLNDALKILFSNFNISYKIYYSSNNIVLFKKIVIPKYTISGFIQDAATGEKLIGANVYCPKLKEGTTTNNYGFFSLTLLKDNVNLEISYIGYHRYYIDLFLNNNMKYSIDLHPDIITGDTITIIESSSGNIEKQTQMSSINIPLNRTRNFPAMLGNSDIVNALRLIPGVHSGNEGATGVFVRGSGPDQNLILLDDAPIYNSTHLYGFFSIFNSDAIHNVNLIKGGFPARYGGRLSSVLQVNLKEGNKNEFVGKATLGLMASKVTLEGPYLKNKGSYFISGRRSYIHYLAQKFAPDKFDIENYQFYDLNAKFNYSFSNRNRIYFSIYQGNDYFNNDDFGYNQNKDWGNLISSLRFNYLVNNKLFGNFTFTYSKYHYDIYSTETWYNEIYSTRYYSGIKDVSGKVDFDFIPNPSNNIKTGLSAIFHTFTPGILHSKTDNILLDEEFYKGNRIYSNEFSFYIEDEIKFTDFFSANFGINNCTYVVNSKAYYSIQPRISTNLIIGGVAIKNSYAAMHQNIHLLTSSGAGLPEDLWVPATEITKPQQSDQFAMGVAKTFNNMYEFSLEAYYKKMNNLIEFAEGASFLDYEEDWQNKLVNGKGDTYGLELFFKKKHGKTFGWIGYTLAWSDRKFPKLNSGKKFPYTYDRRHDFKIALTHQFYKKIDMSLTWMYGSGNAMTLPIARYSNIENSDVITYYGSRNSFRLRPYHRLDVAVKYYFEDLLNKNYFLTLGVFNAYNRHNPYYIYFKEKGNGKLEARQVTVFPITPFLSFTFTF